MDDCARMLAWTGERVERTNARGRHGYCESFKDWNVKQARRLSMSMTGRATRNNANATASHLP